MPAGSALNIFRLSVWTQLHKHIFPQGILFFILDFHVLFLNFHRVYYTVQSQEKISTNYLVTLSAGKRKHVLKVLKTVLFLLHVSSY